MKEKKDTELQKWENVILKLDDSHFFGLIHAYFGAVETPFNKHNLLEKLISFLRNKSVKQKIINALVYEEIQILTIISYLKNPSLATIIHYFFDAEPKLIKMRLVNLEERLLIYKEKDEKNYNIITYSINPILEEALLPILNLPFLMPSEKLEKEVCLQTFLNPIFFLSLYSFICNTPDLFKKDGTCKKKVLESFVKIFPALKNNIAVLEELLKLFISLNLLSIYDDEVIVIEDKWKAFANLSHLEKVIYLCVGDIFNEYITKFKLNVAEVLNELLGFFQKGAWYSENDVYRTLYIVYKKIMSYSDIDHIYPSSNDLVFYDHINYTGNYKLISIKILDLAESFGLLLRDGTFLAFNEYFREEREDEKPLLISSTFEVTLNQNSSFAKLLPLLPSLKVIVSQTFASFEFNRLTCEKLFKAERTADEICQMLQSVSFHEIPQNVSASIRQWYESYKSISIYHGFVLCVDKKKKKFFEKNTPLSNIVKKEIAEGVYLLNLSNEKEIDKQLKKAGLDFILFDKNDNCNIEELNYFKLKNMDMITCKNKCIIKNEARKRECEHLIEEDILLKKLSNMELDLDNKSILQDRIKRRVILVEQQLTSDAIHNKIKEIGAFDFLGKIKMLEEAKLYKNLLEITLNDNKVMRGYVSNIFKTSNGIGQVQIVDDEEYPKEKSILNVSQILKLKLVLNSIFS